MKKFVTKFAAISMATMMAVSMVGCADSSSTKENTEATSTIANPIKEVSEDDMIEETGIDLPLPAEATDVAYSIIESEDGNMAQVDFTLNGDKMYLRACTTSITSLNPEAGEDADLEEILGFDMEQGNISGLNYEWTAGATNLVKDRDAIVNVSKEGAGYVAWLDVVPGILYNLCMEKNADADKLVDTANKIFVPMQDEVDGDADAEDSSNEYADLLNEIYATKAGSAGSSERVEAAAKKLCDYVTNHSEDITGQNQEALATDYLSEMMEEDEENFIPNFEECFGAVVEAALGQNPDLETDVTFSQVTNGITNAIAGLK